MKISLITATLNRSTDLFQLINSLLSQTYQNFELIIVDQSNEENWIATEQFLAHNCLSSPQFKHIRMSDRGLSKARNIGLAHASGNILAFPDDDCWYAPDVLDNVSTLCSSYFKKGYGFISGCCTEPGVKNPNFANTGHELTRWSHNGDFSSNTLFFDASISKDLNAKFDPLLGCGAPLGIAEELDYVLQFTLEGHKGIYIPSLILYHPIDRKDSFTVVNGRANAYIFKKYASKYKVMLFKMYATTLLLGLKGLFRKKSRLLFIDRMKYFMSVL